MKCSTCFHSSDAAKDKMPGWLICDLAKPWNYRPPQSACSFDPVRYVARKEPKAAK